MRLSSQVNNKKMLTVALAISAFAVIGIYLYRRLHYWHRKGLPSFKFFWLFWIFYEIPDYLTLKLKQYGRLYGSYNFMENLLFVADAKVAREISIKEFHKFPTRYDFHLGSSNFGKSLFFMAGNDDWKRVRSIVSPAFTSGKLKSMLTPIERIVENFIKHLEKHSQDGKYFDIKQYTSGFTMDVIASCAFGANVDSVSQPNHPIVGNAKKILSLDVSVLQLICFICPPLARLFRLEAFDKDGLQYFDDFTFEIIDKRLKSRSKQNLIGLMMENDEQIQTDRDVGDRRLAGISKEEIAGQGLIFFLAGFETTNTTFGHVMYYLTKHPEWQERLYEELSGIEEINYDSLRDLKVLNAVINETLRLKPPLTVADRRCTQDHYLKDYDLLIEKGTYVSMQLYTIQRDAEYFPEPDRFKPERFVEKPAESHFAFMPFGVGPRHCVGMRFALNELRIGLAMFVLHYQLVPNPDLEVKYFKGNILLSQRDVMVQIRKRV